MKLKIEKLEKKQEDNRGSVYDFVSRATKHFLVIKTKKGITRGEHYHTGKIASKNPEILVFASGKAEVYVKDLKTGEEKTFTVDEPTKMMFYPYEYHSIKALTECLFFEINPEKEERVDTIKSKQI